MDQRLGRPARTPEYVEADRLKLSLAEAFQTIVFSLEYYAINERLPEHMLFPEDHLISFPSARGEYRWPGRFKRWQSHSMNTSVPASCPQSPMIFHDFA